MTLIGAIDDANLVLKDFLLKFNRKFAVPPPEKGIVYRQLPTDFDSDRIFCFKYSRVVGMDNVVTFGERQLQILPTNGRLGYARTRVEVQERLDGSIAVYYEEQCLATISAPPTAPVLRARHMPRVNTDKNIPGYSKQQSSLPITHELSQTKYKPAPPPPVETTLKIILDRG